MPIPQYAQGISPARLVRFLCKSSCGSVRYGEVSKASWSSAGPNNDPELYVQCLKCGGQQRDNYNWMRI